MRRRIPMLALLVVALAAGVALAAEIMNVKLREATVRSGPKHFKPAVATLKYGDTVEVLETNEGWLKVRLRDGQTGYLHESAVTDEKLPKELPGGGGTAAPSSVSRDEVSLAGKGFNPQVEKKYREQRPNLEQHFKQVDAMERRAVSARELDAFLRDGQLGGEGRQP